MLMKFYENSDLPGLVYLFLLMIAVFVVIFILLGSIVGWFVVIIVLGILIFYFMHQIFGEKNGNK